MDARHVSTSQLPACSSVRGHPQSAACQAALVWHARGGCSAAQQRVCLQCGVSYHDEQQCSRPRLLCCGVEHKADTADIAVPTAMDPIRGSTPCSTPCWHGHLRSVHRPIAGTSNCLGYMTEPGQKGPGGVEYGSWLMHAMHCSDVLISTAGSSTWHRHSTQD
jgi:hypothetical protein